MKRKRSYGGRSRRRVKRSRRSFRRRVRRGISKRAGISTLSVKRTTYDTAWTFSSATTNGFWRYNVFSTANMSDFAQYAAVFDEYKLCAIKQTWRPRYDSVTNLDVAGTIVQPQAYAHLIVDPESSVVPTGTYATATVNSFLENGNVRTVTLNKPFSVYFRPKIGDTLSTGSRKVGSPWLPVANVSTFAGYHMLLQQNNMNTTNTNITLDSFITFYIKFRGSK